MPKYFRRRKRTFKKKRMFKKRFIKGKSKLVENMLAVSCSVTKKMVNQNAWLTGDSGVRAAVSWLRFQTPNEGAQYGLELANTTEFKNWAKMFLEFKVSGLKIEYQPWELNGRTISQGTTAIGTFPNPLIAAGQHVVGNATQDKLAYAKDNKSYKAPSAIKRYYKPYSFFKKTYGTGWFRLDGTGNPEYGDDLLQNPVTYINTHTGSAANTDTIAEIKATWYVKFRRPLQNNVQ